MYTSSVPEDYAEHIARPHPKRGVRGIVVPLPPQARSTYKASASARMQTNVWGVAAPQGAGMFFNVVEEVFFPHIATLLADVRSMRACPCICRVFRDMFHPEAANGGPARNLHILVPAISKDCNGAIVAGSTVRHRARALNELYRLACRSAPMPSHNSLTDADVEAAYGPLGWKEAFFQDEGHDEALKCGLVTIQVDVAHLVALPMRLLADRVPPGGQRIRGLGPSGQLEYETVTAPRGHEHPHGNPNWSSMYVESQEFELADSTWKLRLQVVRASGAMCVFLVNQRLRSLAEEFSAAELALLENEDNNLGSVRAEVTVHNGRDPRRNRKKVLCSSFGLVSHSWGWSTYMPAVLFAAPDLGYVEDGKVTVSVRLQWWLNDIFAQPVLPDHPQDPDGHDVYNMWQEQLCSERDSGWESTAKGRSMGELARLTKEETAWLDSAEQACGIAGGQGGRLRGRLLRTFLQMGRSVPATERYLSEKRHLGVTCDGCGLQEFRGVRRRCKACGNYDLCGDCFAHGITSYKHMSSHEMEVVPPHLQFCRSSKK